MKKDIPGTGPYCLNYGIDLLPLAGDEPSYGQLSFIDSLAATDRPIRTGRNENNELQRSLLTVLANILTTVSSMLQNRSGSYGT